MSDPTPKYAGRPVSPGRASLTGPTDLIVPATGDALPLEGEGIPDEIRGEIPRLTEPELLRCIAIFPHEYVARFGGSPESVLSAVKAATKGVETGYGEAIEKDRREPEEG